MAAATEAVELAAYVGYIDAVVGYYWGGGRWCAEVEFALQIARGSVQQ